MDKNLKQVLFYCSLALLLLLSFFKDDFSPDYRNTPSASFLDPQNLTSSRIDTLATHPAFWIFAIIYSLIFIGIPAFVLWLKDEKKLARIILWILSFLAVAMYVMIFFESRFLDVHIITKINRYFHSPVFTLFLIAAIKIRNR